jgi:hypothetical protein
MLAVSIYRPVTRSGRLRRLRPKQGTGLLVCITAVLRDSCRTKTILFGGNVAAAEGILEAACAATDVLMTAFRTWKRCEQAIGGAEAADRTRLTQVTWAR